MRNIFPKTILFLFVWCSANLSFAQLGNILTEAEEMPYFPGCESFADNSKDKRACSNKNLVAFISNSMVYPTLAKDNGIEGTVVVAFVVNEHGLVEQKELIKDIGGGCGDAALQILEEMPRWEAGIDKGKSVNVKLRLPLTFSLKSGDDQRTQKHSIAWGQLRGQQLSKSSLKENMYKEIIVRDQFGNTLPISQLTVSYEKGKRYIFANSRGNISKDVERILKKAKKGGQLTLLATVHDAGDFVEVQRTFSVE